MSILAPMSCSPAASDRRDFLAKMLSIGLGSLLGAGNCRAEAASAPVAGRIDVHHHILPPEYVRTVGQDTIGVLAAGKRMPQWSVQSSLDAMDRNGISCALVSISAPGMPGLEGAAVRKLARGCNEFAAQMMADHPGRFGSFASLPLPDVQASLAEIEHALDHLHCDGIGLLTNYEGRYLGEPEFAPVFDELNRRKAVVYVHPTNCPCNAGLRTDLPAAALEFPHDTTRTVTDLLYSGTFARCPDIRFIFSHGGGTIPFLAPRIALLAAVDRQLGERVGGDVIQLLQRLNFDTALSANRYVFASLLKLVDPSKILLGTDFPFGPEALMRATVAGIRDVGLAPGEIEAIERTNAVAMFSRLGPRR